jgi:hypothetical protein
MARNGLLAAILTLSITALVFDRTANAQSCPLGSHTATVAVSNSIREDQPPWNNVSVRVPKFSPAPGQTLIEADIRLTGIVDGSVQGEDLSPSSPCQWAWCLGSAISVQAPASSLPTIIVDPEVCGTDSLSAFDGTVDFGGTSGVTHANLHAEATASEAVTDSAVLANYFTGSGAVTFSSSALDTSHHGGCGSLVAIFVNKSRFTITVTYTYCSAGADMCVPGRDGVIACPCNNAQHPPGSTKGCENSAGSGGAVLSSGGQALLSADTVVFSTAGELSTATSVVLQGNALVSNGVVFAQGVRCAGGVLKRLYTKTASGGGIVAPQAGDASVSTRSAALGDTIVAGQTRWYVVYYRDPSVSGGCPASSTFNATQGQATAWQM